MFHPDDNAPPDTSKSGVTESVGEFVYHELLTRIRDGSYAFGMRLPSEIDLAASFNVSRPILRNALARLRDDGLIVSRKGAGSYVSSGGQPEGMGFSHINSVKDMAAFCAFRKHIETEAASLAAQMRTPEDVAKLREILADMDASITAGITSVDHDMAFHVEITRISDNRFLEATLKMLRPHMYFLGKFVRSLSQTGYAAGKKSMQNEHTAIVDAIERGDSQAARQAMVEHIDLSEKRIFTGE